MRPDAAAPRLDLKPLYTVAEIATALGFVRRNGYPDGHKAERRMRQLGVPVSAGRPRTVLADDIREHAPNLFRALTGAPESAQRSSP